MRTTLTLDDDVAAKLKAESRRSDRPFRDVVNETLRLGLAGRRTRVSRPVFKVNARDLGKLRPGLSLDNISDLIDLVEGPPSSVILIDANLLLYAYHPGAEQHRASRAWLEATLSGSDLVRFAWLTLWAFLRISTSARVFDRPLSMSEAESVVCSWLDEPIAGILDPGDRHWEILQELTHDGQAAGPLVMDAVIASIAVEHGATLCTTDRDFSRFPKLKWMNPLLAGQTD